MKSLRRIFLLVVALAMVFSMAVVGRAAGSQTSTITIINDSEDFVYEAYEVFAGDMFDGTLSNIVWGSGISDEGKSALLNFEGQHESAEELATALTETNVSDFANEAAKYLNEENMVESEFVPATDEVPAHYKIENLFSGYYLIRNRDVSSDGAYTNYILEVVGDSSIRHKATVPVVEKKVKDINDSNGVASDWHDSADYDKGDTVPFQLTAVLADNVSTYKWYKIEFQDTLSYGLTYVDDSVKVYLSTDSGRQDVSDAFAIDVSSSGEDLTISCNDVKGNSVNATNNSVIVVEYDAVLNNNAVIGAQGNVNEVVLAYSNNPYWYPEGFDEENPPEAAPENPPMGYTAKDKVVVFTYQVTVNKVDENNNPLPGAAFDLYKKESNPEYVPGAEGSEPFVWVKKSSLEAVAVYVENSETIVSYSATFDRLDDGDYKICESVTPNGYNTCEDILFTIAAEHDTLNTNPALTLLSGGNFVVDMQAGSLSTDIINKAGTLLPETGGVGTTMFYIVGACLVLASVILWVSKKRMR